MDIKFLKRVDTNNKTNVYKSGEQIDITLPKNKLDITTLKLFFDVYIDPVYQYNDATYLKRFLPRNTPSIIQELIFEVNGEVKQHIKEYNVIYNIIHDASTDEDDIEGNRIDSLNISRIDNNNNSKKLNDFINSSDIEVRDPLTYRLFIDKWIGLIGENSNRIIDCRNHNVKISIVLAPKYVCYRGLKNNGTSPVGDNSTEINYNYHLSNVYANLEVYPDNTPVINNVTFNHYHIVKGTINTTKDNTITYKHKGKLNYMIGSYVVYGQNDTGLQLAKCNADTTRFGTTIINQYDNQGTLGRNLVTNQTATTKFIKSLTTENHLDNSEYFRRNGNNIKTAQFSINGVAITPLMSMNEIYTLAKEFFNGGMKRVQSIASFENEFFVMPMHLNITDENMESEIQWTTYSADRADYDSYPILIFNYDKSIDLH